MLTAKFLLGVGAALLSLQLSSASSPCSSAAYEDYLPLSSLPAAKSYCSTSYPQPTPTRPLVVTSTITETVVVSTRTSTITPARITVTVTAGFTTTSTETDYPTNTAVPTTTAVERDVVKRTPVAVAIQNRSNSPKLGAQLTKLKSQPKPFIQTVCSCIDPAPTNLPATCVGDRCFSALYQGNPGICIELKNHTPTQLPYQGACSGSLSSIQNACSCITAVAKTDIVTKTAASTATVRVTLAPVAVTTTTSTTTTTTTTTCASYTATCSDVINGIMSSNSIISPQLVDYRMQSALLGLTNSSDFLAALGPDPCQTYTDPTEHDTCVQILANSDFVSQLTNMITGSLTAFDTCASDFAAGGGDYQIVLPGQANATCGGPGSQRRRVKRFGGDHDLTENILAGIEEYRRTAAAPVLGLSKSNPTLIQLARRQSGTCATTASCFQTCPSCRDQQTYCGSTATGLTTGVCLALAAAANIAAATAGAAACTAACAELGPASIFCGGACARVAGPVASAAVAGACAATRYEICNPLAESCANCNSENNGICNQNSSQCCPGETGTQCGQGCCCCPVCQAPGGVNCACTAAPC